MYKLVPLSAYGKPYTPPPQARSIPASTRKPRVREQVHRMGAIAYFTLLAALMKDNPPARDDAPMVDKMAKSLGFEPGKDFDASQA